MRRLWRLLPRTIRSRVPAAWVHRWDGTQTWDSVVASGSELALASHRETFVVSTRDQIIAKRLWKNGEFDFRKFESAMRHLDRRNLRMVVDVGANVGSICIPATARGLADRAIAIEPEPDNARLLACNVLLNRVEDRVRIVRAAVTDGATKSVVIELSSTNSGDHRVRSPRGPRPDRDVAVVVDAIRLDDLEHDFDAAADLLWMDIQGYEIHAFEGAARVRSAAVPTVFELWPYGLTEHGGLDRLMDLIASYGWFVDLEDEAGTRRPIAELRDLWTRLGTDGEETDVLLLPA
jgi:FkbM family methyltransferase